MKAETFRVATRHWLEAAADAATPDLHDPEPGPTDQVSRLHTSRTFEGWLRVDGYFAPQDADLVEAALDAGVDRALRGRACRRSRRRRSTSVGAASGRAC